MADEERSTDEGQETAAGGAHRKLLALDVGSVGHRAPGEEGVEDCVAWDTGLKGA